MSGNGVTRAYLSGRLRVGGLFFLCELGLCTLCINLQAVGEIVGGIDL